MDHVSSFNNPGCGSTLVATNGGIRYPSHIGDHNICIYINIYDHVYYYYYYLLLPLLCLLFIIIIFLL